MFYFPAISLAYYAADSDEPFERHAVEPDGTPAFIPGRAQRLALSVYPQPAPLADKAMVSSWHELCLFLGGTPDSFTGRLLDLVQKSDPVDRARLRAAYPRHVAAFEAWQLEAPHIAAGELAARLAGIPDGNGS